MRIIKIFLASSSELKDDREQFEIFINRKNKEYIKKSIFLELVLWEDFFDHMSPTRLQDEYNKAITDCDVFVSLFYTKVGQYTEEEFLKALETFKSNNKLLIYTYFNDSPISPSKASQFRSLLDFKDKLSELGHFYKLYKNIGDLKYLFDQQLNKFIPELTDNIKADSQPEKQESEQFLKSQIRQLKAQIQESERSHQSKIGEKDSEITRLQNTAKSQQEKNEELTKKLEAKERSHRQQLEEIKAASSQERKELEKNYQRQKQELEQFLQSQIRQLEQQLSRKVSISDSSQAAREQGKSQTASSTYRQKYEEFISDGELSEIESLILKDLQQKLGLKTPEVEAIHKEVSELIKQYQNNLNSYQQMLTEFFQKIGYGYSLQELPKKDRDDLKKLQVYLKLKDKDIARIETELTSQFKLKSEKGVDYSKLRDLLEAGKWKQANQETTKVMLEAASQKSRGLLVEEDIDNFPWVDLRTINQLWLCYSNGKFGFSVQKEIYEDLGGTRKYDRSVFDNFGDRVGWRKEEEWFKWLDYDELTFNLNEAPKAHLPWLCDAGGARFSQNFFLFFSLLLSRKDL